jgi:hypothetical protein
MTIHILRTSILASLVLLTPLALNADTITIGSKSLEGKFKGVDNSRILFEAESGETLDKHQAFVNALELTEPYHIRFTQSGKREEQSGTLHGLTLKHYGIEINGQKTRIPSSQIKEMIVQGAVQTVSAGTGGGQAEAPIDTEALRQRKDLTPAQLAAINRYDQASKQFYAFLDESTRMVRQMDAATGGERGKLLLALRERKARETPLRTAYQAERAKLEAAFPNGFGNPVAGGDKPAGAAAEFTLTIPDYDEGTVLLIDTGFLEELSGLSPDQLKAIEGYKKAKKDYQVYAAQPPADSQDQLNALNQSLLSAQKTMLGAFPNLKIVSQ